MNITGEMLNKLGDILRGTISREDAASWAFELFNNDDYSFDDITYEVLDFIAGVDLRHGENLDYLDDEEAIKLQIDKLSKTD